MLSREEREELNALSLEVFGTKSKWQKILDKGYTEVATTTVNEEIPGDDGKESTIREHKVPLLTKTGGKQSIRLYHTPESIKEMMLEFKKQKEEFMAMIKKQQDEAEAKKAQEDLQQKVSEQASGSAL